MDVVRWSRHQALSVVGAALDDLGDAAGVVLEGVTSADDAALGWCRDAPCPVVAVGDGPAPGPVDVAVTSAQTDEVVAALDARPGAAGVLVDVLRTVAVLDVARGLAVESLAYSLLLAGPEHRAWLDGHETPPPDPVDGPLVRSRRTGDELAVTLSHPARRNALCAALRDALVEALAVAEADPTVSRVVLDGDGPVFCSGGDLGEFGSAPDVVVAHRIRTRRSVGAALERVRDRAEVRVHGRCVGAGVELPAFAARVVAAPDTTFRLPEVGMGLIPGAGGTVSLTHRIGRQATAWLALTGREVDLGWALDAGLVDEVTGAERPGAVSGEAP